MSGLPRLLVRRLSFPRWGKLGSFATVTAIAGVAIGIALMMLVLSVMAGFEELLKENYTRITSEIVVHSGGKVAEVLDALRSEKAIKALTPFFLSQALLVSKGRVAGLVFEGIDPESSAKVVDWKRVWRAPPLIAPAAGNWIWLGIQAAEKLGLRPGDTAEVVVAGQQGRRSEKVYVTLITKFGIYDHDLHYARVDAKFFRKLFGPREPFFKLKLSHSDDAPAVKTRLQKRLGGEVTIRLWSELNRNIFLAVKHQKKLLFLVLEIIIALSAVNVVNLLLMNTHYQKRDISILRAMGMHTKSIFLLYLTQGAWIGAIGITLGLVLGSIVCALVKVIQPALLSEAVYNVTRLPISVEKGDVFWVGLVAFLLCILFSVFPAWRAMRLPPAVALRQE